MTPRRDIIRMIERGTPLSTLPSGSTAQLVRIDGGGGLAARLAAMGLVPGVKLTVIRNSGVGPFIVGVDHLRIALGRSMTHKMYVE